MFILADSLILRENGTSWYTNYLLKLNDCRNRIAFHGYIKKKSSIFFLSVNVCLSICLITTAQDEKTYVREHFT